MASKNIYRYLIIFIALAIQIGCTNNKANYKSNSEPINNSTSGEPYNEINTKLWNSQFKITPQELIINNYSLDKLSISNLKADKNRLDIFMVKAVYIPKKELNPFGTSFSDHDTLRAIQIDDDITGVNMFANIQSIDVLRNSKIVDLYWAPDQEFVEIEHILSLNVELYYWDEVRDKYKTELQKKIFLESENYQNKLGNLKRLKKKILKTPYYIDLPIGYSISKYDLETNKFRFQVSGNYYKAAMNPNVFQFDHLLLKLPSGIKIESDKYDITVSYRDGLGYDKGTTNYRKVDKIRQTIYFNVNNERTAYDIETSGANLRLFFVINFTGIDENNHVYSKVNYLALYNHSTGEIYKVYQ